MRFAAYAGTSLALAAGTVIRAFHERSNFYSASVALAQSNASLMILTNLALLGVAMFMLGLQRLFYGPLRPIEVEQLYEKAWFAITETCLAMTIFREEVGGWFLVMFVGLLIGKVWGWIGEGRVEILEQQPPPNPRMFHTQLSLSLSISALFDFFMLRYAVNTVLRHARPNMMVMFAFEFAVLTINSLSTAARYGVFVFEANVIRKQINERRSQMRRDRERAQLEASNSANDSQTSPGEISNSAAVIPEEDIDTMEFDPPGWEDKGRWIFYLDLTTDFFKLILYLTFFCVLCMFYGMPIHIIRDVALTIRSFHKRIRDFMRYRQATRDMNKRYPDATVEEVAREDVCIICRENMRSWSGQQNGQDAENRANQEDTRNRVDERTRPKKLPCGHILHFACLRSWLERQQNCPTCRRPVLVPSPTASTPTPHTQPQEARAQAPAPPNQPHQRGQAVQAFQPPQNPAPPPNVYQFGPIRIAFGARPLPQRPLQQNNGTSNQETTTSAMVSTHSGQPLTGLLPYDRLGSTSTVAQLQEIEQQVMGQINGLRLQRDQLYLVRALQAELSRLRLLQTNSGPISHGPEPGTNPNPVAVPVTQPRDGPFVAPHRSQISLPQNQLPPGITIPMGWTLTPLRRLPANTDSSLAETPSANERFVGADLRSSSSVQRDMPESMAHRGDTHIPEPPESVPAGDIEDASTLTVEQSEAAATRESTYHEAAIPPQSSSERAEDILSNTTPTIPGGGSVPIDLDTNATMNLKEHPTDALGLETGTGAGESQNGTRDKGKGKATTVEDSTDDVD